MFSLQRLEPVEGDGKEDMPSMFASKGGALQAGVIRSILESSMEALRDDVRNLHVDMIRQMHDQQV